MEQLERPLETEDFPETIAVPTAELQALLAAATETVIYLQYDQCGYMLDANPDGGPVIYPESGCDATRERLNDAIAPVFRHMMAAAKPLLPGQAIPIPIPTPPPQPTANPPAPPPRKASYPGPPQVGPGRTQAAPSAPVGGGATEEAWPMEDRQWRPWQPHPRPDAPPPAPPSGVRGRCDFCRKTKDNIIALPAAGKNVCPECEWQPNGGRGV